MSNPRLEHVRRRAESGVVTESHGLNRGETKIVERIDLLYSQFTQGNKSSLQHTIPSSFIKGSESGL